MPDKQLSLGGLFPDEPLPTHSVIVRGKSVGVKDRDYLDLYWQFIFERQSIWYKRFMLQSLPPWTEDDILRNYKFTNMYRELDRGTIYLLDNIIGPVLDFGPPSTQVFACIMYRMFNRVNTWQILRNTGAIKTMPWHRKRMFEVLSDAQSQGIPLYTDAHMVCAYHGTPGKDKLERIQNLLNGMEPRMAELMSLIDSSDSLKPIWTFLKNLDGLGPFLAYEIAVDISYAPWNHHTENEWVNPGPGCQIGVNIIFPNTSPKDCTQKLFDLRDMQQAEFARLKLPWQKIAYKGKWLTLRNIEHDCCEFQKYVKALNQTGRPRNRFKPIAGMHPTTDGITPERLRG
jgi:hypothetical protein